MNSRIWPGSVLLALSIGLCFSQQLETNKPEYAMNNSIEPFARCLLGSTSDLRSFFYGIGYQGVLTYKTNGLFLLIKSPLAVDATGVSTNECSTVESALIKYSPVAKHRQIRVIQENAILQTPFPDGKPGDRQAILTMRLQAGDVLIVTYPE